MVDDCEYICVEKTALNTVMFCKYLFEIRQGYILCDNPLRRRAADECGTV